MMQQTTGSESDVKTIEMVRETHVTALNTGDVETWAGLFSEDGVQMPPNQPANVGREMIRSWSQAFLQPFRATFALSVKELRVSGDSAFEWGGYTISLVPKPGGEAMEDVGKYITIYERQADGSWKVSRDIWNSDNPPFGR